MSSRLKIEKVECDINGLVTQARVQLSLSGDSRTGIATTPTHPTAWQQVIAEATLEAVRAFMAKQFSLTLDSVAEVTAGRFPIIVVTLALGNEWSEQFLSGTAPTLEGRYEAVTKAVLHGLNRKIEPFLVMMALEPVAAVSSAI
ncbi:MAG: hypothetical protein ACRDFA_04440 [bacterium]|jgi:hypothetical protein